ncbi:hypothetical protein DRP04_08570 [Archaeoglobales archaeon]|nr:MAG: hypothetical protein DRP04_08570 [Archaeoglobales archaeon]
MHERLRKNNLYAAKEIIEKLLEANKRGYWDADQKVIERLEDEFIEIDGLLEEKISLN